MIPFIIPFVPETVIVGLLLRQHLSESIFVLRIITMNQKSL